MLVKVVRDQFALKRCYSRLKEGFSHTESLGSQGGKSPDNDDEVINAESTRSLRGKEVIVQNIKMIVEKQCQ